MPRWYVLSPLSSILVLTTLFRPCPSLTYRPPSLFFSLRTHNRGGSHTHPCLVTRTVLSLVTRAFGSTSSLVICLVSPVLVIHGDLYYKQKL